MTVISSSAKPIGDNLRGELKKITEQGLPPPPNDADDLAPPVQAPAKKSEGIFPNFGPLKDDGFESSAGKPQKWDTKLDSIPGSRKVPTPRPLREFRGDDSRSNDIPVFR